MVNNLTPKLASDLANFAYQSRLQTSKSTFGLKILPGEGINAYFNFDTQKNMVKGVSGGVICRAINLESGFVNIGFGRGSYIQRYYLFELKDYQVITIGCTCSLDKI